MMRYTFWYGGVKEADQEWLQESIQLLKNNEWKASTPLYFDGLGWGDKTREVAAVQLLRALQDNTSARSLFLRNATLGTEAQEALAKVFERNSSLTSISLKNVRSGNDSMVLPASLFQNSSLKELFFEKCTLDKESSKELSTMLRTSTSLQTLFLDQVQMEDGLKTLTEALPYCQSLRQLTLNGTRFTDHELNLFFDAVGLNQSLETVNLEGLKLSCAHTASLANMLQRNRNLRSLSLRRNDLDGKSVGELFSQGILYNSTLNTLLLAGNPIGDEGVDDIVSVLQTNSSLHRLCLANCEIWIEGCSRIAVGLAKMKGLRRLTMDCNDMELCVSEILQSLKQGNFVLHEILSRLPSAASNRRHEMEESTLLMWKQINFYLRLNKAGRRVFLQPNAAVLLPSVLEKERNNADIIFALLQSTPL